MDIYSEFGSMALDCFSVLDLERAFNQIKGHPTLMRRLVNLEKEGVKISSAFNNPWHDEMKAARINNRDVEVAKAFYAYKEERKKAELNEYFKSGRAGVYSSRLVS